MVLSDCDIKLELAQGRIVIEPLDLADVQPASVDVRLGSSFRIFRNSTHTFIDPTTDQPELTEPIEVPEGGQFVLHSGPRSSASPCPTTSSASSRASPRSAVSAS